MAKVIKSWDHTWEKPTEYQMEQMRIAMRAAREEEPDDDLSFLSGEHAQSPTLRLWATMDAEKERWKIN
jgi:hypothetical protein